MSVSLILTQRGWWVSGVFDGRTGALIWQQYEPNYAGNQLWTEVADSGPPPDFDQDGIPDQVSTFFDIYSFSNVLALSGVDGQTIWKYSNDLQGVFEPYRPGNSNYDLTNDGIPDLISAIGFSPTKGEIACINGSSGLPEWVVDWNDVVDLAKEKYGEQIYSAYDTPIWVSPSTEFPNSLEVFVTITNYDPFSSMDEVRKILRLSGDSGEILGFVDFPRNLMPWSNELTRHLQFGSWSENAYLLGDIDNDGFTEIGLSVLTPSLFQWNQSHAFAIVGESTLSSPAFVSIGENVELNLFIPSAPGQGFRLIYSDKFDPIAGEIIADWKTHLGSSPTLSASLANPISGVLDQEGRAVIDLPIPIANISSGDTLFFRALIEDPFHSNEVFTMSSLAESIVQ